MHASGMLCFIIILALKWPGASLIVQYLHISQHYLIGAFLYTNMLMKALGLIMAQGKGCTTAAPCLAVYGHRHDPGVQGSWFQVAALCGHWQVACCDKFFYVLQLFVGRRCLVLAHACRLV